MMVQRVVVAYYKALAPGQDTEAGTLRKGEPIRDGSHRDERRVRLRVLHSAALGVDVRLPILSTTNVLLDHTRKATTHHLTTRHQSTHREPAVAPQESGDDGVRACAFVLHRLWAVVGRDSTESENAARGVDGQEVDGGAGVDGCESKVLGLD